MSRTEDWISRLSAFPGWDIGGSGTQLSGKQAEEFVAGTTRLVFRDAWVLRLGSQQHPDFLVGAASWEEELRRDLRLRPTNKVTKSVAEKWETAKLTPQGQRWVRLEVKTGDTVYTLNDTFPAHPAFGWVTEGEPG